MGTLVITGGYSVDVNGQVLTLMGVVGRGGVLNKYLEK